MIKEKLQTTAEREREDLTGPHYPTGTIEHPFMVANGTIRFSDFACGLRIFPVLGINLDLIWFFTKTVDNLVIL